MANLPVIEHRWVNTSALKEGLLDFSFLMESFEPGTIPEPQLIAALLDLVSLRITCVLRLLTGHVPHNVVESYLGRYLFIEWM